MNIRYVFLRLIRHWIPESAARFLLKRRWIIRPGLESSDPLAAANRYIEALSQHGRSVEGRRVLIFGYGGRFAVGVELLKRGAAHVILCDHFVLLDDERNNRLLPEYARFLDRNGNTVKPNPNFITLLHGDILDPSLQTQIAPVDYVLSTSVYEHLGNVEEITRALANLTTAGGIHLHFVDLRDHYFKYPFQMLAYSERIWKTFLNPTSNLNRLRLPDYERIFKNHFRSVDMHVLERLEDEFSKARPHIRQEFLTGDRKVDAAALIRIIAEKPVRSSE